MQVGSLYRPKMKSSRMFRSVLSFVRSRVLEFTAFANASGTTQFFGSGHVRGVLRCADRFIVSTLHASLLAPVGAQKYRLLANTSSMLAIGKLSGVRNAVKYGRWRLRGLVTVNSNEHGRSLPENKSQSADSPGPVNCSETTGHDELDTELSSSTEHNKLNKSTAQENSRPQAQTSFLRHRGWKYDVFLCHSGNDKGFARLLYKEMRKRDLLPFFNEITLPGQGGLGLKLIAKAVVQSPLFVAILSPHFKGKRYPEAEAAVALVLDKDYHKVPVFYETTADKCGNSNIEVCRKLSSYIGYEQNKMPDQEYASYVADHIKSLVQEHSEFYKLKTLESFIDDLDVDGHDVFQRLREKLLRGELQPLEVSDSFRESDKIEALLVTAVAVEHSAVVKVLRQAGCKKFEPYPILGSKGEQLLACMTTSWKVDETSRPIKVAVTKQTDMGAGGAADIGTALKTAVDCNAMKSNGFVAMAGICAGHKDKTRLGDVLVPWKLSSESGGKDTPRGHQTAAEYAEIKRPVKLAIEQTKMITELETSGIVKYIPETMRGTPSPRFLLDATLLQLSESLVDTDTVHEALIRKYKWPEQVITAEVIEEALGKVIDQKYAEKDGRKFKISPEGALRKNSRRFPRKDDSDLRIWHEPVVQGATVRMAMDANDWADQGSRVGQRKAVGYEMEGYTFLSQSQKWCNDMNQLFVKVVSDQAAEEYKMDYYQEYAACVAAAFVLRVLKDTPSLAGRQAVGPR